MPLLRLLLLLSDWFFSRQWNRLKGLSAVLDTWRCDLEKDVVIAPKFSIETISKTEIHWAVRVRVLEMRRLLHEGDKVLISTKFYPALMIWHRTFNNPTYGVLEDDLTDLMGRKIRVEGLDIMRKWMDAHCDGDVTCALRPRVIHALHEMEKMDDQKLFYAMARKFFVDAYENLFFDGSLTLRAESFLPSLAIMERYDGEDSHSLDVHRVFIAAFFGDTDFFRRTMPLLFESTFENGLINVYSDSSYASRFAADIELVFSHHYDTMGITPVHIFDSQCHSC